MLKNLFASKPGCVGITFFINIEVCYQVTKKWSV